MTNNFPNFTNHGYEVNEELGHNRAGGRITYLATAINTQRPVVVKQFQFDRTGADWTEYTACEQEIKVLQNLDHFSIPRYLDSFPTPGGFCMVQEYKNAPSLNHRHNWTPQQVKQIAMSVLEILKYLQSRIPPIIHRDLKPENILVDERLNVYLVDFGFARTGGGEVTVSSVVKGTLGFMPPEQMFNRQLTVASDLYSLGATLICLLTKTPSLEISTLMDDEGKIKFKHRVPHLSHDFISWLQKMVEPNYKDRYANAEAALKALIPLEVLRPFEMPKWVVPTSVGLAVTAAVAGGVFFKFIKPAWELANAALTPKGADLVIITTNPESPENISTIDMKQKRVYFGVTLGEAKAGAHQGMCQLFDGVGALVGMGESTLEPSAKNSQAWCWYDFNNPKEVQPGEWKFKFSLDGQVVAEQSLQVVGESSSSVTPINGDN
ncbi:MAG TPA: serine/threonine protein kinase [Oscillatoriaceae cyanobacterium M33_DOE_052]|uniref:non-specific serine/threonine protein kinase n=1 Tax=Planktothricoides sp. SpSt-374 TaxID=2282167 RepID=A0A7C3VIR9_9CYAN|nr:serine/threonine protein kinase [Oscillatoriaceae cyanobacterium M33_DOE_052]